MSITNLSAILPRVTARFGVEARKRGLPTQYVSRDFDNAPAAQGDTINIRRAVAGAVTDVTPSNVSPVGNATSFNNYTMTLNRHRKINLSLNDKELSEIEAGATNAAIEAAANEFVESESAWIMGEIARQVGQYKGTAGTSPFVVGGNASDATFRDALALQSENKARLSDRTLFASSKAYFDAFGVDRLVFANARGDGSSALVDGQLRTTYGANIVESHFVPTQATNALGAGALTVGSTTAPGATVIPVAKGAGANFAAQAGDILTIGGRGYRVASAVTVVQDATTNVTITEPLVDTAAAAAAITLVGAHTSNLLIQRNAVLFASRPLMDNALTALTGASIFQTPGADPQSGMTYRIEVVRQHKQTLIEMDVLYGLLVIDPQHCVTLLG